MDKLTFRNTYQLKIFDNGMRVPTPHQMPLRPFATRHLGPVCRECSVVELPCTLGIEAEIELVLPSELEPSLGERVVPVLCTWVALRKIGRVCGELVGHNPFTHIIAVGEP